MIVKDKLYTTTEFEQIVDQPENRDRLLELFRGEITEKVPNADHSVIAAAAATFLSIYNMERGYPGLVSVEGRHLVGDDSSLIPDASFFKDMETSPGGKQFSTAPDLAVEVKSPGDSRKRLREKAAYYLENGSQMVWLFFPETKQVEVHRPGKNPEMLGMDDVLDGGDVLPGFSIAVREFFRQLL